MSIEKDNSSLLPGEDLRNSEIRYRRLFESARDGILILDADSKKITDVNPFLVELLGYGREEFLGKELWEIGLLKDEQENRAAFRKLQTDNYIRYENLPLETKNGVSCEVEFISNVYTENNRQVIQCNIRDITKRKIAEAAMRQVETNFRNLVESSPGILYLNEPHPPYSTVYVCAQVEKYGYSPEEWCATPGLWASILHSEDRERVLSEFESAVNGGHETELEYRIQARDGRVCWWHDKGRFIFDEDGNKTNWQGIILDITKTKELEQQLLQAHKLESVGLLAGGIAHDFNNMLTAINGYSDLALRSLEKDSPLRVYIEEIKEAGERSAALTHQLLAFSRRQVLQPSVIDLNAVIIDIIKMLQRLIGEDIQLTTTLNPKVGRVVVDSSQLSQILMNLALNARDAMARGGRLTITTDNISLDAEYTQQHVDFTPGDYVLLSVSDTGAGMSEQIKQHIFEPFFTTKETGQGTGLGLAVVYGIVKQSGGNIEFASHEDAGTTFKIYLPRVEERVDGQERTDTSPEMATGTETILLVEDEEQVRKLSCRILEACGYKVIEARNGLEALGICGGGDCQFDLLVTDVVMPQMGGSELAEKLKSKLPNLKILFTSGYTDEAVIRHGVIVGNTNFIQKPFAPDDLANKIRKILDDSQE